VSVHLKRRDFQCNHVHCDKAFGTKGNLKRHLNAVHLEKKEFKCDHCDMVFAQKAHLADHVNRIHKNIKSYSCELCNYTSCTTRDLKGHSIRRHNPTKAHRHDLDALIKEAQKDEMIVLIVENITVFERWL
jgi:uncharacterized C2H2 Zn-finger protein